MPSKKILECSSLLAKKGLTVAFAESATAGRLSAEFSLTPESGKILKGGLVCYDAGLKVDILKVPQKLIELYTPESAEVTAELARRLGKIIAADIHVAVTGLTAQGGSETSEKPVGTMFIHVKTGKNEIGVREVYTGSARQIVRKAIDRVARCIIAEISTD